MATAAEARQLQNALVLHQVELRRLSLREAQIVHAMIGRMEERLAAILTERVLSGARGTWTTQRASLLRREVEDLYRVTTAEIDARLSGTTARLGVYESRLNHALFERILGVSLRLPSATALAQIGTTVPFEGALLGKHIDDTMRAHFAAVQQSVADSFAIGETLPQIVRRVIGEGSVPGDQVRRNTTAIVRTAIAHTSGKSSSATYRANKDVVEGEVWVSVLDGRTTPVCWSNSGATRSYEGEGFGEWSNGYAGEHPAHFQERSVLSPWLRGTDASRSTPTTYEEWLSEQSSATQDDILGPTRAALWRDGKVEIGSFTDPVGRLLSLAELAEKEGIAVP